MNSANKRTETPSRHEMLNWVNDCLNLSYIGVEKLCTGEAYCLLVHKLFPGIILLDKVKFGTNLEHEYIQNFVLVQDAIKEMNVDMVIL
jgi:microtubule-associated protein, RP/EB family